jgi:hypothetical protein
VSLWNFLFGRPRRRRKRKGKKKRATADVRMHRQFARDRKKVRTERRRSARRSARVHDKVTRKGGFLDWTSDDPYGFFS